MHVGTPVAFTERADTMFAAVLFSAAGLMAFTAGILIRPRHPPSRETDGGKDQKNYRSTLEEIFAHQHITRPSQYP